MKEVRIKDICDKGSSSLKQKDVEGNDGKYPVYGASGIIGKINTYHQEKEYIAIVKDGSGIGRVTFMPAYSSIIGTLQYILPKEGYNIKYISYCLQSLDLAKYKQGAAIPHIYFRDYGEYLVKVTDDLSEQERIVSYLDAQFAKIDALKANTEQQLQAAKDLFQSALKEMLTPKEGWERKMLKDVSTIIGGSTPKTSDASNWGGNNNWVTPAELNGEKYYGKTKRTISDKAAKGMQLLPVGTVLLSSRAPIGKVAITTEPMYCNQGFKNIVCSNVLYNEYVYWYMLFSVPQLEALGIGATFKELSKSRTEEFLISFPSLPEQERITARLDTISEKVKALQDNYDQTITLCNDLKQALLKSIFE